MKICVLVKEVPDAAVEKRIDPSTGRLDRSGEKNLNPYDTHAIEAAMQIREGGAAEVDEIVAGTRGPGSAVRGPAQADALGAGASVRVRLPNRPDQAAGGDPGRRRDQRAALSIPEGDHGRAQEALGEGGGRRRRARHLLRGRGWLSGFVWRVPRPRGQAAGQDH